MASLDAQLDEAKVATGRLRDIRGFAQSEFVRNWEATRQVTDRSGGTFTIPGAPWHFSTVKDDGGGDSTQVPAWQGEQNAGTLIQSSRSVTSRNPVHPRSPFHRHERKVMSNAKLVVLYPQPTDPETFEKAYANEHIPLMHEKMKGMKAVITKMSGTPTGPAPHFYMAEIYAPSVDAIKDFLNTPDGQEVAANAAKISTGGPPGPWPRLHRG